MKVDKGMTCGFEENIRRILTDAEQKLIVDPIGGKFEKTEKMRSSLSFFV